MIKNIKNIKVEYPDVMSDREVQVYVEDAIATSRVDLARIDIKLIGDEVDVKSYEKSPISRVRRITGYCVKISNMNEAKKAEIAARKVHFEVK